jgi:hypothetical protein
MLGSVRMHERGSIAGRVSNKLQARWPRLPSVALATCAATLLLAPAAGAVTLGHVAPASSPVGDLCGGCHGFQAHTASSSPSYKVPAGKWTISSWRTRNITASPVGARLWVFRPTSKKGQYRLVGRSDRESIPAHRAPSFTTHVRVRRGDRLGIDTFGHTIFVYDSAEAGDITKAPECNPSLGQSVGGGTSCSTFTEGMNLVNVSATAHRR